MDFVRKHKEQITGLIMFLFSAVMFRATFQIDNRTIYSVGPRAVPQIIILFMLFLSALTFIGGFRRQEEQEKPEEKNGKAAILTLLLMFAYVFLFDKLGFILDSVLYLFLQFTILETGKHSWIRYAIISVVTSALIFCFFRYVLLLMLPTLL